VILMLAEARAAYERMEWGEAFRTFQAADLDVPLGPVDLEAAARTAQLLGRQPDAVALWTRAIHEWEVSGDNERAAICAHWLAMSLMHRGETARADGWWARGQRLIEGAEGATVAVGYLLLPQAVHALFRGDAANAYPRFVEALRIGERFSEIDLTTLSRLGVGQSLIELGRPAEGLASLDDAMVSVLAGEVSPMITGLLYCSGIETCHRILDLRRASQWTDALTRWCDAQPDLVPFRGQCLTHRAQLMRMRGAWNDALDEAQRAYDQLAAPPPHPALAEAIYEKAELHRLRGKFADAEAAYRDASQLGKEPQPGLALLRLAQGKPAVANAAIRRIVGEHQTRTHRAELLAACVDIRLAVDDVEGARHGAEELAALAATTDAPFLHAISSYASGAVAFADGDARAAMGLLRKAWSVWCELEAPYEQARARLLIGLACRELGDEDTAAMELDMARGGFVQLGAAPDVAKLDGLASPTSPHQTAGLTGREIEVLELVAAGQTNREIAKALIISEKTVARHISNIFTKLAVTSRAAATSYALRRGLV
jgi:DNA-binding CsgD family transcriptional regulator